MPNYHGIRPGGRRQDFFRQRLTGLGLSMIAMGVCFPLYYMGFFGGVEGPLSPEHLGQVLAGMGISKFHILGLFLFFLLFSITWNWLFNLVSFSLGSRMTCCWTDNEGTTCGAPVKRTKVLLKRTGTEVAQYVCSHGHKRPDADFHPVKKGVFSHSVWVTCLLFCAILFYLA